MRSQLILEYDFALEESELGQLEALWRGVGLGRMVGASASLPATKNRLEDCFCGGGR